MSSKLRYYLFLIIAGLSIGYFLATRGLSEREVVPNPPQPIEEVSEIKNKNPEAKEESSNDQVSQDKTDSGSNKKKILEGCFEEDFDIQSYVNDLAAEFETQKIMYNSKPLSDCSGIFLRFCREVSDDCPQSKNPTSTGARDTRRLARWYYGNKRLTLIQDAKAKSEMIRPGAIMFYGRRDKKFDPVTIQNITASNGIEHVGVVTEVERNSKGVITNYTLFHGRSSGKIASRTTHHHLNPSRKDIPPYGNWNQQWVAVAYLFSD